MDNDFLYLSHRTRRVRRVYSGVAFVCTVASFSCAIYALLCGMKLRDWPERDILPDFIVPEVIIATAVLGLAATMTTGSYAYCTRKTQD